MDLPSIIITFLFTGFKLSTKLWEGTSEKMKIARNNSL